MESNKKESAIVLRAQMPLTTMQDAKDLATLFAQAHVLGASNPAEGMLAVAIIREVGIVRATSKYQIMMGQLSKKAHAILGDFCAAGGKYKVIRRDADCAEALASIGETQNMTFRFTWEEAMQEPFVYAGSPKEQWQELAKTDASKRNLKAKYRTPRSRMQMLWARVASDMGNTLCPDCGEGMYPPEVVEDFDAVKVVQPISTGEAQARAIAATSAPVDAEPPMMLDVVVESAEVVNGEFDVCPIDHPDCKGQRWDSMPSDWLKMALEMEDLAEGHKETIRKVLGGDGK